MPSTKLYMISSDGLINGNGIKNSNKYSWNAVNINKNKRENPAPNKPWMIPSTINGKRMKLLVAPKRCKVSIASCFE